MEIPALLVTIAAVAAIISGGIFYVLGLFNTARKQNQKEAQDANLYVIASLEKKIAILEKKTEEASNALEKTNKRLDELQKENALLREILQGRDTMNLEFQKLGLEVFKKHQPEINMKLIQEVNENILKLSESFERHHQEKK